MTSVHLGPTGNLVVVDLWSGEDSLFGDLARIRVEPRRWWLFDPDPALLAERLVEHGAAAPIGGGLVRATITGPCWRALLMVAGLFDAEDPGFTTGSIASTIIHHVTVRIAVTSEASCNVYFAASFAPTLIALWTAASDAPTLTMAPELGLLGETT